MGGGAGLDRGSMMFTVIIPYRDNPKALRRLLDSYDTVAVPTIVVDDLSNPPIRLRRKGVETIYMPKRGYFAGAVNAGIQACDTDVLVLNQDIWFTDDRWLEDVQEMARHHAIFGDGVFGHPAWPEGYVQGTCMYVRRDAIERVGTIDAAHWPLWGGTAEWQLRICRAGFTARPLRDCRWFQHERGRKRFGSSIEALLRERPERRDKFIRTPPLVSVVTACYNYGRYLTDWVNSMIGGPTSLGAHSGQTFQGFELVIVDDASTDDSWDTARALADPWKGIRAYRRHANGGTAAALNSAIRRAYGRYIMTVDADDMLEPEALERFLAVMEQHPGDLLYSDMQTFGMGKRGKSWQAQEYDFNKLLDQNQVPAGTMFAKTAWRDAGGFPEAFGHGRQDWAFAVAMGAIGHCGRRIPSELYLYRREGHNRSLRNTNPRDRAAFRALMERTFPSLYQEGRQMPRCCGGRGSRIVSSAARSASIPIAPGSDGMVLLEYIGANTGRQVIYGPITRTRYSYKGSARLFYVDAKDAGPMLEMVRDRAPMFRLGAQRVSEEETVAVENA